MGKNLLCEECGLEKATDISSEDNRRLCSYCNKREQVARKSFVNMRYHLRLSLVREYPFINHFYIEDDDREKLVIPIRCGDGWYELIKDMCDEIKAYLQDNPEKTEKFKIENISEKYGELRVCFRGVDIETEKEIDKIVLYYDKLSKKICEECGCPGVLREKESGWLKTLCNDCVKKNKFKKYIYIAKE
ncbi:hypothetical protein [Natranaerofaba carboxydovora]|uniref:hypothetical protein n=1 Tax=Natranaerofaba carboxydovora TaxID=2742683 RepID=UPI001F1480F1|nr:hypothetical protein [Natranaerofaba carboxydovora]UMZ73020.1 hypothetical protein ACONDI_00564 [Natranaerofaba carboxydovora]